jgi:hypothetical protein
MHPCIVKSAWGFDVKFEMHCLGVGFH